MTRPTLHKSLIATILAIIATATALAAGRATLAAQAPRLGERDSATMSLVSIEQNALIFPGSLKPINTFEGKLDKLLRTRRGHINVWHVGGSHVQADILSHRLRCHFATLAGTRGTRGMLFPFAMARTNSGRDYSITHTGAWTTARNIPFDDSLPLGITGIAAATSDQHATITLNLDNGHTPVWDFDALRILAQSTAPPDSLTITLSDDNGNHWQLTPRDDGSYGVGHLPTLTSATLTIDNPTGARFILNGIEPVSGRQGTINYYSSGINGASTASWLHCQLLQQDLMRVKPDLVIFGIGINDAATTTQKFDPDVFKERYNRIIDMIKAANPDVMLLFITNNDSFYHKRANANALIVRDAMVELARQHGGCVWDCLGVMGGLGSSTAWRRNGLMAKDRIHFTRTGYELCADLLFEALITDYIDNDE